MTIPNKLSTFFWRQSLFTSTWSWYLEHSSICLIYFHSHQVCDHYFILQETCLYLELRYKEIWEYNRIWYSRVVCCLRGSRCCDGDGWLWGWWSYCGRQGETRYPGTKELVTAEQFWIYIPRMNPSTIPQWGNLLPELLVVYFLAVALTVVFSRFSLSLGTQPVSGHATKNMG